MLLQLLDDGRLTDGHGRTVDFRNTVVIMTSNIRSAEDMAERFRLEFLNRIDEIVVFEALTREQLAEIVEMQLRRLNDRLAERGITLELTDGARGADRGGRLGSRLRRASAQAGDPAAARTRSRYGCSKGSSRRATRSARTPSSERSGSRARTIRGRDLRARGGRGREVAERGTWFRSGHRLVSAARCRRS